MFWIGVGTVTLLGMWSAATATYFAFRDDVLTRLIARQTEMQYAYEDRIAELRARVDRTTSRQLLDQEQFDQKLDQIMRRQTALESRASALGAISTIFAEYLGYFLHFTPAQVQYVAAAAILVMGFVNYVGVQTAARFMNLITALKYGSLAGLVLLALTAGEGSVSNFTPAWNSGLQLSLLGTALISIMWTYDGWADLSFMGGEVKDPGRTLPLALILGTASIVVV